MKILITGARGNFPTALMPRLIASGHDLVLFDIEPIDSDYRAVQGDIRDSGAVLDAMRGCDAVVHAAAYHGDMIQRRNHDDYHSVNVTGTHNVLLAMYRLGIKYLVFSSSEVVYGSGMKGRRVMDEKTPRVPNSIYSLTKLLCEQMCEFYSRQHGFIIAMLRYGCFVPANWKQAGVGRLTNWLDRDDVAQANMLALGCVIAEAFHCEPFLIHCQKPFQDEDWPQLAEDPEGVVEGYWPGSIRLLAQHGLSVPRIHTRFDISKAQAVLGYDPEHNFDQFLIRLRKETATHPV
jgi:UDP-glucose 4-epimerase